MPALINVCFQYKFQVLRDNGDSMDILWERLPKAVRSALCDKCTMTNLEEVRNARIEEVMTTSTRAFTLNRKEFTTYKTFSSSSNPSLMQTATARLMT